MSWNTDDMTNEALRMYESRARAAEMGDMGMAAPDDDDGIDDDGIDTLTGQSVLSSWMQKNPWAQDEPGVKVASGYGEAALTMGSGIAASIPAGLAGLGELARGNGMEEAAKTIEGVQQWLTMLPKTPEGKKALEQLVPLLEKLSVPAEMVGGAVLDASGSPAAATAAEIVLDPLNAVIPAGAVAVKAGVKGVAKSGKSLSKAKPITESKP